MVCLPIPFLLIAPKLTLHSDTCGLCFRRIVEIETLDPKPTPSAPEPRSDIPSFEPEPSPLSERRHAADEVGFHGFKRIRIVSKESRVERDEAGADVDPYYAQLLYECLKEAPDHKGMSLKNIYEWVRQHGSQKAKDSTGTGWQNRIRHNLSMNAVSPRKCAIVYHLYDN
jgi:hypothetical protein